MTRVFTGLADRYRIEREIGAGGMATVYLARDLKHDRDVALKVLRPELAAMLGVNRFLNEIRISARLDHPHILTLIDSGVAGNPRDSAGGWFPYYVMPFVRGESLRDRLKRDKQLALGEALDITRQIASALDYAHGLGIVHRDIKPENILIREGEAVLADFGIAVAVKEAGGSRLTESGVSLGTPQYMSPEQATGDREPDARSDVYSMAAVLYEMLAGDPPHTGSSIQVVIAKLLTERPTPLRVLRDTVPEGIDAAVAKALAKLPADRFSSAGDFSRALAAPAASTPRRLFARPRRLLPLAIGGALATVVAIAAALVLTREPAPRPQPEKVQLTLTGNAGIPSLSRDGRRLAFREQQCNQAGCTYNLVIQDLDGSSHLVLSHNLEWIWGTRWTDDGRFLLFWGSYGGPRRGMFVISTLGGAPRHLGGDGGVDLVGDTALISAGVLLPGAGSEGWLRRVTVHDGQTVDSLPVHDVGHAWYAISLAPDRLLVVSKKSLQGTPELRLTDLRGRVIDRATPQFGSTNTLTRSYWVPAKRKLVGVTQRDVGGTVYDVFSLDITPSAIGRRPEMVLAGIEARDGIFHLSQDGERLLYYTGPVESELSTIDVDPASRKPLAVTPHVLSSTTRVRGRLSPVADKILLARDIPRDHGHASQFSVIGRTGGEESLIAGPPVENVLDFDWSPDGAEIMYLHRVGGGELRLTARDTTGRTREIKQLTESEAIIFHPLADGGLGIVPTDRHSLAVVDRPGKRDTTWPIPNWMSVITDVARSPDGKSLAVAARSRTGDTIVVTNLDLETGNFARLAAYPGEDPLAITWVKDGSIRFVFRGPDGAFGLYKVSPGRPAEKLGALPYYRAQFSMSNDGRHVAAFGYNDKNDVYMIRNFGELLR